MTDPIILRKAKPLSEAELAKRATVWTVLAELATTEEGREMLSDALAGRYILTPAGASYKA